jgi:hypothetical protein
MEFKGDTRIGPSNDEVQCEKKHGKKNNDKEKTKASKSNKYGSKQPEM